MRGRSTAMLLSGVVLLAGFEAPLAGQEASESSSRVRAVHLLNRATFGPRPADIEQVLGVGAEAWLDRQLDPSGIPDSDLEIRLEAFEVADMSIQELLQAYPPGEVLRPLRELIQSDTSGIPEERRRELRRQLGERGPQRILLDLTAARITRAVHSERQLEEVMTQFWFDHFNVFFGKGADRWLVADYEREAIRPYVFGKFEDMLVATAKHPAMLFYLDNFRSVQPDSSARARAQRTQMQRRIAQARRRGRFTPEMERRMEARMMEDRRRLPGLNENYARELLELHTLGVDEGYDQEDVVAVARILTGWGFQGPPRGRDMARRTARLGADGQVIVPELDYSGTYDFRFRAEAHDAGRKVVMGRVFEAGSGIEEGKALLAWLATHPTTARHLATQLATRFVNDDPPAALVDELAEVFLATEGDLRAVTKTLFLSDTFFAPEHVGSRIKSPFVLVTSALRLSHARMPNPRVLLEPLRTLGEAPYLAEPPTGYPETSDEWASSGSLINRMNFAQAYASGRLRGVGPNGGELLAEARRLRDDPLEGLVAALLPGADATELLVEIRRDLSDNLAANEREQGIRVISMILGSPEFQIH